MYSRTPTAVALALALFCQGSQAGQWEGRNVSIDGVVHVRNTAGPMSPERAISSHRLWSMGGDTDEDGEVFGVITKILLDDAGNSYLLDFQMQRVIEVGPSGEVLRWIGRSGEGPGEFRTPLTICFLPGERLGVVQMMPSRIAAFHLSGEPDADFPIPDGGGFAIVQDARLLGENVVIALQTSSFASSKITIRGQLLCLAKDGELLSSLWDAQRELSVGDKVNVGSQRESVIPVWTVGGDTHVYISPSYDSYRIDVVGLDGKKVRVIEREFESLTLTEEEIAERKERIKDFPAPMADIEFDVDGVERDIGGIIGRDNGELWVMSSRSRATGGNGALLFELFDELGRYVSNCRVEVDFDSSQDSWYIQKDHLYVAKRSIDAMQGMIGGMFRSSKSSTDVTDSDLEPPEVVCYRIGYATTTNR